jgi:hypothetical protein
MPKSKEFTEWEFRLDVANRKAKPIEENVKTNWDYYRGNQWAKGDEKLYTHLAVENLIFANTRTLVSQLAFKNPKHFITPLKKPHQKDGALFDTIQASLNMEALLGWYFKDMKTLRETRKCLYDALLGFRGIARLGYTLKTEKFKGKDEINTDELIQADSPFIKRYSEFDFRHDTEGTDALLDDSRWCAFKFVAPLQDIKDNSRYSTRGLKSNAGMITDFGQDGARKAVKPTDDTREIVELVEGWEMYDKKTRRLRVIVPGHDKFLRNEKWEGALDNIEGLPVEILYFNENPDSALPVSDVNTYRPMQDELNKTRSMNMDHVDRISRRRYVGNSTKLPDEELRKITHGGNGAVALVDGSTENVLEPVKDANVSQDIYIQSNLLKASIRQMAGLSQAEALDPKGADSATEAGLINLSSTGIRSDQQGQYEDFNVRLSRKLSMILQKTLDKVEIPLDEVQFQQFVQQERRGTETKITKITGMEGAIILQPWLDLSKEDIQGEYIFDIEMGSTQPVNEETRKRDFKELAAVMQGNPWIRDREATRLGLEIFKMPDPDSLIKSEEEFQQEQAAQAQAAGQAELEDREMKSQVDLAKTKMKTDAQLETANIKAQTELATSALDNQTEKEKTQAKFVADFIRKGGRGRE